MFDLAWFAGKNACRDVDLKKGTFFLQGSCIGEAACRGIQGEIDMFEGACVGDFACDALGGGTADRVIVAKDSCVGDNACLNAGEGIESISVGLGSCVGDNVCEKLAQFAGTTLTVGAGSCNTNCQSCGIDFSGDVSIPDGIGFCPTCVVDNGLNYCRQEGDQDATCTDLADGYECVCSLNYVDGVTTLGGFPTCQFDDPCTDAVFESKCETQGDFLATCNVNEDSVGYTCECSGMM